MSCTLVSLCLLQTGSVLAKERADCEREYLPKFGQRGKDVPWEPTSKSFAAAMLKLAGTVPTDRVYDLGAGDGTIVIAAAKDFGATAVGIEYNGDLAKLGQCYIEADGLASKAKMIAGDIFKKDFSEATVVTMFLWPEVNLRLRPTLLKMAPGTRVVSHMHTMESWKWDDEIEIDRRRAYLWIIPAQAHGTWRFKETSGTDEFALNLKQKYQELNGSLQRDTNKRSDASADAKGKLRGTKMMLDLGSGRKLTGEVQGQRIEATMTDERGERKYVATLVSKP